MKEPTKADLATAVAKLTEENAGLRELLAAVSLAADTVPVAKGGGYVDEWKRSTRVLAVIKNAAALDDWDGYLAWAAGEVRSLAAEPVGYEVYVRPALCRYCAIEPATEGGYCEACAPAVHLATGALDAAEGNEAAAVPS